MIYFILSHGYNLRSAHSGIGGTLGVSGKAAEVLLNVEGAIVETVDGAAVPIASKDSHFETSWLI
jgi:hypothetical protein